MASPRRLSKKKTCSIPRGRCVICTPHLILKLRGSRQQPAVLPWQQTVLTVRSKTFSLTLCSFFSLFFVHPPSFLSSLPFILSVPSNFPRSIRRFCQAGCKTVSEQLFGKQQLGGERKREGSHKSRSVELFFFLFSFYLHCRRNLKNCPPLVGLWRVEIEITRRSFLFYLVRFA